MKKSTRFVSYLVIFLVVFFFGWESASYYISTRTQAHAEQTAGNDLSAVGALSSLMQTSNEQADMTLFWKVWKLLYESHVDEAALDKQKMVYGAIKGMVSSLQDPYSEFMTPDETKEFESSLNGRLDGIGAELTIQDQALVVVSAIKGSPAEKAGLLPDDIVYKIDGNLASEMTLYEAISKIRGEKGTSVALTILRKGQEEKPLEVSITRDEINIASVEWKDEGNDIYSIAIHEFGDTTERDFEKAVRDISLKDPQGVIVDLRFNGGGYLDAAVNILSKFIEGKKGAVIIKKRTGSEDETLYVTGNAAWNDLPLVVLVNKGSASASEIFAGAIQDHKRGVLIGEQTFGKGSVQEIDKLSDGSSIRMTIAKWHTPNGRSIDKVGITPDIIVPLTEEDYEQKRDPQMEQALKYLEERVKK